ncbi:MAG TPA: YdcF family protein [Nitrospira sp.]
MELTPFFFGLYKFAKYALYPLTWVVLLLAVTTCLLLLPTTPARLRWARFGASASFAVLLLISNPIVSTQLIGVLEAWYPIPSAPTQPYDAIVVLGGGIQDQGSLRPTIELTDSSRDRMTCGVNLYQQGYASRLVVTGGDANIFRAGPIEAIEMKRWARRLGVPDTDILTEEGARTTYENATGTKRLLGKASIVLVSSPSHLPRATALFIKQGLTVTPSPCDYVTRNRPGDFSSDLDIFHFLPTDTAIQHSREAVVEMAGMLIYRLVGKL